MIKKKILNKKEIKKFKEQYSHGTIETEVISNLLQPYHDTKYPEIKSYCDFWWPEDKTNYNLIGVLQLIISQYGANALEESFGKYDFIFVGNRKYKNYILDFNGLTIVAPAKREVVIKDNATLHAQLVSFENAYSQFVLDYLFTHYENLQDFEKDSLIALKKVGILNCNNQIDFNYTSIFKTPDKSKPKM